MSLMESSHVTDPRSPVPTPGVPRPPNLKALTSIRFFAALHVALYHFVNPHTLWGSLTPVIGVGYVGVSFFFLLSGFILTYSHAQEYESGKGNAARFWVARLARIYPVYLVSLLISAYVLSPQFHPAIHGLAFVADVFMVQSWSIRMVNFFNVPAWSLSSEAFFYLIFPFLLLPLRPSTRTRALLAVIGFWLLALAVPVFCLFRYPIPAWSELTSPAAAGSDFVFRVRRLPLLALPQFLTGISLGWLYLRFRLTAHASAICATVGALALVCALFLSAHLPFILLHNGLLLPAFALLILGLCEPNWLSKLLSHPWLILLGEASFAFYLIHYLFNLWLGQAFAVQETIPAALWKLAIVIPLSIALHLLVERPGRRIILAWWKRTHPAALKRTARQT